MNKNLIKSFVLNSNYYTLNIDNIYKIPKFIHTINNNQINLENIRNTMINSDKSTYEPEFIKYVDKLKEKADKRKVLYNYLREFPIIIENRELWKDILNNLNILEDKYINTNYFLLDFFFYESDLIVEIDSNYHNGRKLYDKARDIYIKETFGIDTLRFFEYGKNNIDIDIYSSLFNKSIKEMYNKRFKLNMRSGPVFIDFTETLINNYIIDNKSALLFIDSLYRFLKEDRFNKNITIEYSDLHKIYPKVFKLNTEYKECSQEFLLINNIRNVIFEIYGKTLKILPFKKL